MQLNYKVVRDHSVHTLLEERAILMPKKWLPGAPPSEKGIMGIFVLFTPSGIRLISLTIDVAVCV